MMMFQFKCPECQGCQYRQSLFDIRQANPYGAVCIFCKSSMLLIKKEEMQITAANALS